MFDIGLLQGDDDGCLLVWPSHQLPTTFSYVFDVPAAAVLALLPVALGLLGSDWRASRPIRSEPSVETT